MKRTALLLLLALSTTAMAADGPEIRNGDFEKGKQFWRGNGKVVVDGTNKVCELKASERYSDELSQEVDFGKSKQAPFALRLKGVQYTGPGLRIKFTRSDGSFTFYTKAVPSDGSWTDFKLTFNRDTQDEKINIVITPMPGKGSIQIDNVTIGTPPAKRQ